MINICDIIYNIVTLITYIRTRKEKAIMNKFADYIEYDVALNKAKRLLNDDKNYVIGFYILFSINVGLRISDILKIKHEHLQGKKAGDDLNLIETKTNKSRTITLNTEVINGYKKLVSMLQKNNKNNSSGFIFVSQKSTVYSYKSIDRILKTIFTTKKLQVSSHSLRKSFARRFYDHNNQSEYALMLIGEAFNHSSLKVTKRYLGIRKEEVKNIYLSL